jgi:hypothetical protein
MKRPIADYPPESAFSPGRRPPWGGRRVRGPGGSALHHDLMARWAQRSSALLARMGSSKRATHSSTARLLVILWNHGVKLPFFFGREEWRKAVLRQNGVRPASG